MSKNKIDLILSINEKVLPFSKEAILIVRDDGKILGGSEAAYSMIGKQDSFYLQSYLDIDINHVDKDSPFLAKLKGDKIIELRVIKVVETLYYLLLGSLTPNDMDISVSESLSEGMEGVIIFENDRLIEADAVSAQILGYSQWELKGKLLSGIFKKEDTPLSSHPGLKVHRAIKKDGSIKFIQLVGNTYFDKNNTIKMATIRDLSEHVHQDKIIKQLTYVDKLTGLPNCHLFKYALEEVLQSAETGDGSAIAVYYVDLEYSKEINETLGYVFANKLIKTCAQRIKCILDTQTFISRMKTDGFLIYKQGIYNLSQAEEFAESLIKAFKQPVIVDGYEVFISINVGISMFPEHGKDSVELIKHADSAMFDVKNKYHHDSYNIFSPLITRKFKEILKLECELRNALKSNELELFYQPQKNLHTGNVVGFEALLRWKHPVKGYILPGEFIPLAEKNGLIIEMGDWVLREACRQGKQWQDEGFEPVIISVNMSVKQIHQPGLVEKVKHVLEETGLDAHYLELEITESIAMTNERLILRTMQQLKELGVYVSIDDFGTGYSSFKYLSVFPISKLKIDRMFLDDQHENNEAIVKSIIHMSHSLNLRVIAEGVETQHQLEFLKGEKCDEVQGYYFSKPLPPRELIPFLKVN